MPPSESPNISKGVLLCVSYCTPTPNLKRSNLKFQPTFRGQVSLVFSYGLATVGFLGLVFSKGFAERAARVHPWTSLTASPFRQRWRWRNWT